MNSDLNKYKVLFDTMELGVVYQDKDGKIIEANPAAERILGFTKEQMYQLNSYSNEWQAVKEDGTPFPGNEHPAMIALATGKKITNVIMGIFNRQLKQKRWININAVPEFRNNEKKPFRVYTTFSDITEQKELRDNLSRFNSAVENSANAVGMSTPDGKHYYQNKAFDELFGDVGEDPPSTVYVDETIGREVFNTIMEGNDWEGEVKMYGKNRQILNIHLYAYPIKDDKGKIISIVGVHNNITERKKAEDAIRENEERFRTIIEQAADAVYLSDMKGNIIDVNPESCKQLGFSREELLEKTVMELDNEYPSIEKCLSLWNNIKIGSSARFESEHVRKDGSVFPVEINSSAIKIQGKKHILGFIRNITDRKKAEQALKESQERYKRLADASFEGIGLSKAGKIIDVNQQLLDIYGYTREEFLKISFPGLVHPDDLEIVVSNIKNNIKTPYEHRGIRKDGTIIYLEIRADTITIDNEIYRQTVIRDITERKKAEERLMLTQFGIDHSQIGVMQVDDDGNIYYSNEYACNNLGYSNEEIKNLKIWDIDVNLDEEKWKIHRKKTRKAGDTIIEAIHRRKDGSEFPVEVAISFVEFEGKSISFSFSKDISEQKKAKKILSESEKRFRSMIEHSTDAITLMDVKGKVIYESPAVPILSGYSIEERLGKSGFETVYEVDLPKIMKIFKIVASKQGSTQYAQFRAVRKDGTLWWAEGYATNLLNEPSVQAIVVNYRDITDRKLAEESLIKQNKEYQALNEEYLAQNEELVESLNRIQKINKEIKKAKEKAEESDRLKTAFLANMSHEIRTPMNGILGFAGLLENPELTSSQQKKYVSIIKQSGYRMLDIINDLIDISKIEAGQMEVKLEEANLNQLIESLYIFFKPETDEKNLLFLYKKGLSLSDCIIKTDRIKINQILTNLIKNALKYTDKGQIEFGYNLKGKNIEFYVSDSGIGIDPKYSDKIFERFRQGEIPGARIHEGTGLGLSISKAYVEMLKGKIWVKSVPNKGSVFYFTIPYHVADKSKKPKAKKKMETTHSPQDITILVVEDDEISYLFLQEILEDIEINILRAVNGRQAIEMIKSNHSINLVLMDIKMPEMNGLEATKRIKKLRSELPVIAETAFATNEDRKKAIDAGCDDYIAKPIDKDELIVMIRKYLG